MEIAGERRLEENMKTIYLLMVIALILVMLTGCAARPNDYVAKPAEGVPVASFWQGLWQGFISPFAFIISLFNKSVGVYDIHNDGSWYNFGFLLGAAIIFGGGGRGSHYNRR